MPYISTKTYGHNIGLSCAFRQWRAESHCRLIHGYSLAIRLEFEAEDLDVRNWVVDFGGMKSFKGMLEDTFDHKLIVAADDPDLDYLLGLKDRGIADVVVLPKAGCEAFAEYVFGAAETWLDSNGYGGRVKMRSAEVKEHGSNSAIYIGDKK